MYRELKSDIRFSEIESRFVHNNNNLDKRFTAASDVLATTKETYNGKINISKFIIIDCDFNGTDTLRFRY
jgi:hypothetical protein